MPKTGIKPITLPLFQLGFRPFFLGASFFSIVSIGLWMAIYVFHLAVPMEHLSPFQWHAHEMIYGYTFAVIAGFLLTAVKNWTGIQTIYGIPLAILFSFWVSARVLFLLGTRFLYLASFFDLLFGLFLLIAISYPILKSKQYKQMGILSKILLLTAGNCCFYLGYFGYIEAGISISIYSSLYLVIALVLTLGRRLIPFFVERGDYPVKLFNSKWIDISILLLFVTFFVSELFLQNLYLSSYTTLALCVLNTIRLSGWYTRGIWKTPLLWSLFAAFAFINFGFLLFALHGFLEVPKLFAIHALSFGGIGIITMGMMARVSTGHTGRNIKNPPRILKYCLLLLCVGVVFRIILPLFSMNYYITWIAISQVLWCLSFLLFIITYVPILVKARVDGAFG